MPSSSDSKGFILILMLILISGMMVLTILVSSLVVNHRQDSRLVKHGIQAELAVEAGLMDFKALLQQHTLKDDYLIIQSLSDSAAPQLYLVSPQVESGDYLYSYIPLFSCSNLPEPTKDKLQLPRFEETMALTSPDSVRFQTLPYLAPAQATWQWIENAAGEPVARYAYWVEDLQSRADASQMGSLAYANERKAWPHPAPGVSNQIESEAPELDEAQWSALDPQLPTLMKQQRSLLLTPQSPLALWYSTHAPRNSVTQLFPDPVTNHVDQSIIHHTQAYAEQALIPYTSGIESSAAGKPKLNLNFLLSQERAFAVQAFSEHVEQALPRFKERAGGFPDDYLSTLAANTLDYADADTIPSVKLGSYRGIDGQPFLSELVLRVQYLGIRDEIKTKRKQLLFQIQLFAELTNITNQVVKGEAQLKYEVSLGIQSKAIPLTTLDMTFDHPEVLGRPVAPISFPQALHTLMNDQGYWTQPQQITLAPNEHRMMHFATVDYFIDIGSSDKWYANGDTFQLFEPSPRSSTQLKWNGKVIEQTANLILYNPERKNEVKEFTFRVDSYKKPKNATRNKATVFGLDYGIHPDYYHNMGDLRMTHYFRGDDLFTSSAEIAYPENISPNRRNIRLDSYLSDKTPDKLKAYARVQPSEWPDGGHEDPVNKWQISTDDTLLPTDEIFNHKDAASAKHNAIQFISNQGKFLSATELGRIYDPIMWSHTYPASTDTQAIRAGYLPNAGKSWPDVLPTSESSPHYGGGNTLRIGRPEHLRFQDPSLEATRLLDLFHVGRPRSSAVTDQHGSCQLIQAHLNINTAHKQALQIMLAGALKMDPSLSQILNFKHNPISLVKSTQLWQPKDEAVKSYLSALADAIISHRPYTSASQLAAIKDDQQRLLFGNKEHLSPSQMIEWSDAACEEWFARCYNASTVRSRNFRIWIVGQALTGTREKPDILAESRQSMIVFADPGMRNANGSIQPEQWNFTVLHESHF